jgi:hypothetical protein
MKIRLIASALLFFSFPVFSIVNIQENASQKAYEFSVDSIKFEKRNVDGNEFSSAKLEGLENYTGIFYQLGYPEIPVIRFSVLAQSSKDIQIETQYLKNSNMSFVPGNLRPNFERVEKIPGAKYKINKSSNLVALANYPDSSYIVKETGSLRGIPQFEVTLFPVSYTGVNNSLQIQKSFTVEVKKQVVKNFDSEAFLFVIADKYKRSQALKDYMNLKAQKYEVLSFVVSKDMDAEKIRAKIKTLYSANPNLKYALIVGDAEDVPGHESTIISGMTDYYYAAIDTDDYESDINAPDLSVGRIAIASQEELSIVLKKYTRYISGNFSNMNWINHISFLATDDRYEVAEETHNYAIDTHTSQLGFSGIFPENNQVGGDKLYAIAHNASTLEVMKAAQEGRTIINYSGHGAITYWDAPSISQENVRELKSSSLPFVISNACITGDYREAESFAETWQRHEFGAIAFWGSMDSTFWDEDDILERRMYDGIFKLAKKSFAEITAHALAEVWNYYGGEGSSKYYWETYNLFGDPSIELRLKQ